MGSVKRVGERGMLMAALDIDIILGTRYDRTTPIW